MQLSFSDLRKKDVINVADARCLGRICDVIFKFPEGSICAIVVPGRRVWGFRLFDKSQMVIDERKIVKIGNDVILVNVNCGDCYTGDGCPPKKDKKPHSPCSGYNEFERKINTDDY